jgi:hypothetical protein
MFRALRRLFSKTEVPNAPFVDPALGQFAFKRDIGWTNKVLMGEAEAELVLGSDGEQPSEQMLRTARSWIDTWHSQFPKIIDYIRRQLLLREWSEEPNLPAAETFQVESINILWKDTPRTCIIYFKCPGDDVRDWHVTFDGFEPRSFAYDD